MRLVIQRVSEASVSVEGRMLAAIGRGLLILAGVGRDDAEADADYLAGKLARLRIFYDDAGKMNLSVADIGGEALVISQFTLFAETAKGNRPSFTTAAPAEPARRLFEYFAARLEAEMGKPVGRGEFGADMRVSLVNDGPVTIHIDSKERA